MRGQGNAFVLEDESLYRFKKCDFSLEICDVKNEIEDLEMYEQTMVVFGADVGTEDAIKCLRRVIWSLENGPKLRSREIAQDSDIAFALCCQVP